MATVCLVLRSSLSSCATTVEVSKIDRKTENIAAAQSLRLEFAEVVLLNNRLLFSNFIGKFVLYARNLYGLAVHDPWLVFKFQSSVH